MALGETMPVQDENRSVSVLLVTCNQERYIRRALTSLLRQTLDEPIELVIADDSSSDGTLEMIRALEGEDERFRFKYLAARQRLGVTRNYERGFAACSGEYAAVLEGDDYWISPAKLQRQRDFLASHWECDACAVNYLMFDETQSTFTPRTAIGTGYRLLDARAQIADNLASNFSTFMYRKSALDALPPRLFALESYDWIVSICIARRGLIGFLEEPMSVYRLHAQGVWTPLAQVEKLERQLALVPAYDALTEEAFHSAFDALARSLRQVIDTAALAQSPGIAPGVAESSRELDGLLGSAATDTARLQVWAAEARARDAVHRAQIAESWAQKAEAEAREVGARAQKAEAEAREVGARAQTAEAEARRLAEDLATVVTTASWRVTGPLRWAKRLVAKNVSST